jgi:hypothetical protein
MTDLKQPMPCLTVGCACVLGHEGPCVQPCDQCPDGYEWAGDGPTGRACHKCNGHAILKADGSAFDAFKGPER